jgi:hypothetical protein
VAERLGSRWQCSNGGSPPASEPRGEAWSECGTNARKSWAIPQLTVSSHRVISNLDSDT